MNSENYTYENMSEIRRASYVPPGTPFLRINIETLQQNQVIWCAGGPCLVLYVNDARAQVKALAGKVTNFEADEFAGEKKSVNFKVYREFAISPGSEVAILKEADTPMNEFMPQADEQGKRVKAKEVIIPTITLTPEHKKLIDAAPNASEKIRTAFSLGYSDVEAAAATGIGFDYVLRLIKFDERRKTKQAKKQNAKDSNSVKEPNRNTSSSLHADKPARNNNKPARVEGVLQDKKKPVGNVKRVKRGGNKNSKNRKGKSNRRS